MTDGLQDRKNVLERHVYTINLGETVLNSKAVKKKVDLSADKRLPAD